MTSVISDRPARNGPWAAGLAASEEKSGAAETYESNIYQPTDMIFVHNFTQPDLKAKSFTTPKCVICDGVNASIIKYLGIFFCYKSAN